MNGPALLAIAEASIQCRGPKWWVLYRVGDPSAHGLANARAAKLLFNATHTPEWRYA